MILSAAPARAAETPSARSSADAHFLAGFDHFRAARFGDARREWSVCRELDETHDFCEFGLSVLDARAPKAEAALEAEPRPVTGAPAPPSPRLGAGKTPASLKDGPEKKDEHEALQTYFTGLIYYQKGDRTKARTEWKRALALSPKDSSVESDAKGALEKLDKDEASTRGERKK